MPPDAAAASAGSAGEAGGGIDVVYVNYDSTGLLLDSVRSLLAHASAGELARVVVVDVRRTEAGALADQGGHHRQGLAPERPL